MWECFPSFPNVLLGRATESWQGAEMRINRRSPRWELSDKASLFFATTTDPYLINISYIFKSFYLKTKNQKQNKPPLCLYVVYFFSPPSRSPSVSFLPPLQTYQVYASLRVFALGLPSARNSFPQISSRLCSLLPPGLFPNVPSQWGLTILFVIVNRPSLRFCIFIPCLFPL